MMKLFVVIALVMVCSASTTHCLDLPHKTCTYAKTMNTFLTCEKINLDIPRNFDVQLIPTDAQEIWLDCPGSSSNNYCNMLHDDCQPIPSRTQLTAVVLKGFRTQDESRPTPPFGKFIADIKSQITLLRISNSKVGSLDADFLRGLHSLKELWLSDNGISAIAPDTFRALVPPSAPVAAPLSLLDLRTNALESVDFSVLEPVASTLDILSFYEQRSKLKSLILSGPAFQLSLGSFDVSGNALVAVPNEVLDVLTGRYRPDVEREYRPAYDFTGNNLCDKLDCSCRGMQDFIQWAIKVSNTNTSDNFLAVRFTCAGKIYEDVGELPHGVTGGVGHFRRDEV